MIREEYVPEDRLWALMAACDAIVSLRSPTMGETSGSAIRALSLGKPLVVSDVGWFSELPGDAVLKVPVDEREEDDARSRRSRRSPTRTVRADDGRARAASSSSASTGSTGSPRRTRPRSSGSPAADAVAEQVLREVARAGAEVGHRRRRGGAASRRGCGRSALAT